MTDASTIAVGLMIVAGMAALPGLCRVRSVQRVRVYNTRTAVSIIIGVLCVSVLLGAPIMRAEEDRQPTVAQLRAQLLQMQQALQRSDSVRAQLAAALGECQAPEIRASLEKEMACASGVDWSVSPPVCKPSTSTTP